MRRVRVINAKGQTMKTPQGTMLDWPVDEVINGMSSTERASAACWLLERNAEGGPFNLEFYEEGR